MRSVQARYMDGRVRWNDRFSGRYADLESPGGRRHRQEVESEESRGLTREAALTFSRIVIAINR